MELAQIAGGLDVEPELGALLEEFAEFEGHFRRDAAATEHDFLDVARADAKGTSQGVLENVHGNEVVLKENFTGRDGGLHRGIFIRRFRRFLQIKSFETVLQIICVDLPNLWIRDDFP